MRKQNNLLILMSSAFILLLPITIKAEIDLNNMVSYSGHQEQSSSTYWRGALERGLNRAIEPDDYVCSNPTAIDFWLDDQFNQIDPTTLFVLDTLSAFYWAGDAKLLADHDAEGEQIGVDGEYTQRQNKTFKNNRRFWDIYSDDILLMGMHGSDIANDELMNIFMPIAFASFPEFIQQIFLEAVRNAIVGGVVDLSAFGLVYTSPGIPAGFDNPLLSFNAFAFTSYGQEIFPGSGIIPDKILMGEGIIDGLTGIGIGYKEAPDFVLSHEFAHHVQYEIGAFESGPRTPEKTRRTELMADGFAAYFNSHTKGNTFQAKRIIDIMDSAYEVGDCGFTRTSHHGTHLQRQKAVIWGEQVSDNTPNQGFIYSSYLMLDMFDEALPTLVAPDAP